MVKTVDLRNPHQWFPVARALQRRIIYHAGPTNSGKTYNALQAMRAAGSGVYCGPLRWVNGLELVHLRSQGCCIAGVVSFFSRLLLTDPVRASSRVLAGS